MIFHFTLLALLFNSLMSLSIALSSVGILFLPVNDANVRKCANMPAGQLAFGGLRTRKNYFYHDVDPQSGSGCFQRISTYIKIYFNQPIAPP